MKDKRVMSYRGHVIWMDWFGFMVALKRDGTDEYFDTIQAAMDAIDAFEDGKGVLSNG